MPGQYSQCLFSDVMRLLAGQRGHTVHHLWFQKAVLQHHWPFPQLSDASRQDTGRCVTDLSHGLCAIQEDFWLHYWHQTVRLHDQ